MGSRIRLSVVIRLNRDITPEEHLELRQEFAAQVAADPPRPTDFQLPPRLQALGLTVQDVEYVFDVPLQRRYQEKP